MVAGEGDACRPPGAIPGGSDTKADQGAAFTSFQRSARLVGSSTVSSQTILSFAPALGNSITVLPKPWRSDSAPLIFFCSTKFTHFSASSLFFTPLVSAQVSSQASAPSLALT